MNISTSECSSGCESGWTMYWDQLSKNSTEYSSNYTTDFVHNNYEQKGANHHHHVNEEEDLSMVSDASSAPPNYIHENYAGGPTNNYHGYGYSVSEDVKKKSKQRSSKTKETTVIKKQHHFCLDDTATSPIFHFSQATTPQNHNSLDFPAAHFEFAGKKEAVKRIFLSVCCAAICSSRD
ncbi:hypothetical protein DH2020_003977 [Rehmannia glutinosa]|uniref:Uncharacterized protein n=1 Tax=Rehmannia glutinosa TaxID=99300 RepID=A0ABR0XN47_REHGL